MKIVYSKHLVLYCLSFCSLIFVKTLSAQQQAPTDSLMYLSGSTIETTDRSTPIISNPYLVGKTGSITTITDQNFNQGLVSDPLLLLQGRVAGLQVYNRGGDPNVSSLTRVRGLSAYSNRAPLIVIDGVAGGSLDNVDPNDIASITVLKDGSAQALYGIRASSGVFLVTTKSANYSQDTMTISYQGQFAVSSPHEAINVTDATAFRAAGGLDFGSSVNWLDEVQRNGLSNTHGLAIGGRKGKTNYRVSGNYRNVEGILRKSGFNQLNMRANLASQLLNDRLTINISAAYTDRTSQAGFQDAFRYANSFNPTIPLSAQASPYPYNAEQYGGYYQPIGLFDSFNPKAIVDLNDRDGQRQVLTASTLLAYQVSPAFSLNVRYAQQDHFSNERIFYAPQSIYGGNANSPFNERRGTGELYDTENTFSLYEFFGNYQKAFAKTKLNLSFGTAYQDGNHLEQFLQLNGFSDPAVIAINRIADLTNWQEEASYFTDTINNGWSDKLAAFYGQAQFSIKDQFFFSASIRREGSSKLGENNQWGTFSSFGVAWDLKNLFNVEDLKQLKIRTAYGLTGALPGRGGLSQSRIILVEDQNGDIFENIRSYANPDLKWEQKAETNLGIDFKYAKIEGFIDWYSRTVSDWIQLDQYEFSERYTNRNSFRTSGLELGVSFPVIDNNRFKYKLDFVLANYRSKYQDLGEGEPYLVSSGCCGSLDPIMPAEEGGELGVIIGPFFEGVAPNGNAVFTDLNNDGQINISSSDAFSPDSDFAILGYGLPNIEWGWNHSLQFSSWQLDVFFRGASGHSLVNKNRLFYERNVFDNQLYNIVNTELAVDGLRFSTLSSLYVESGSFLKLDNLKLSKRFKVGKGNTNRQLQVSLSGQNLLVFTDYTGADPEPVFEDYGIDLFGGRVINLDEANPLVSSIDRRRYYLPARTFTLGVQLGL